LELVIVYHPHLLPFILVGYAGADPYLLKRILIIRGWLTVFDAGCDNPKSASPYQLLPLL
ncbi:MAG: hypothetical protein IIT65_02530, partial [Lachnospiraceae bacterium]|nr:hypothetical protein [Lachnospiraceae bacterium]